ncbi:MAG: DUF3872 domain-containing protein [Odoribacter sp.]|nr:DUF3872 domain-containing protein [Odoribacter sp.]
MRYVILLLCIIGYFGCSSHLDIRQDYKFEIEMLPIPKKLQREEMVALEFAIIREEVFRDTRYSFRYFQSDGKGVLMNDKGEQYVMNRYYPLNADVFKMLYRSKCTEGQTLDFVFMDNFGLTVEYSVAFQNAPQKQEI